MFLKNILGVVICVFGGLKIFKINNVVYIIGIDKLFKIYIKEF